MVIFDDEKNTSSTEEIMSRQALTDLNSIKVEEKLSEIEEM